MPQHCTHCNITWSDATLEAHSPQRGWEEENVPVCPMCKSGLDLQDSTDLITYSMSLTGVITNDLTGKVYKRPSYPLPKTVGKDHPVASRGNYVADGTTCLCCSETIPNHKVKCVLYAARC